MEKWHGSGFYLMGVLADIGRVWGSEGEGCCVKTLNINVNNSSIIINII